MKIIVLLAAMVICSCSLSDEQRVDVADIAEDVVSAHEQANDLDVTVEKLEVRIEALESRIDDLERDLNR